MENAPTNSELSGQTIGDYRLLRRLGTGGMADVYLAVQESLKRNVALKILKQHLSVNEEYVDRFQREAQAAAALVHANIVQIFEVGHADGYHFIAQEYVRGRNLREYLKRYGAVTPDMAMSVFRQAARALQKGAEHGVVHRDIKPENIMLTANGELKITDFGLALIGNEPDNGLTRAGITVGTPLYMSPEQIEGSEVDIRSDIYSLGVTLYHMLVGQPPFDGETPLAIAIKHTSIKPDPIEDHRADLPGELSGLIEQMLAKKVEDRPQTPMQLMKSLQSISVEKSDGFDWQLFELQSERGTTAAGNSIQFTDSATQSFLTPTLPARPRLLSGFVIWPAIAILSLAAWWGGSEIANQSAGIKHFRINPTDIESAQIDVPLESDVEAQYANAYWSSHDIPSDDYERQIVLWHAVQSYFPIEEASDVNKTRLYHLRALCRLGEIYIESGDLDKASEVYDTLADQEEMALEFRVTGLAGKAVTLSLRPDTFFGPGGIQEQQSKIRLCLDDDTAGVRKNLDLLNDFLKKLVQPLLEEYKSYGSDNLPIRRTNFANRFFKRLLSFAARPFRGFPHC